MLRELLRLLGENQNGLSLKQISRQLNIAPGTAWGMVNLLVQKGRIIEIGPDGGICTECGVRADCQLLLRQNTRYVVVPVSTTNNPV